MASNTSGLFGTLGYNLLNPRDISNPFGAGGYFALNPTGGTGSAGTGSPSARATTINIGAGAPDFASAIENDPAYAQLKSLLSAQGISDSAHLRGAIQQALIQFGAVPKLPGDVLESTGLDTSGTQALAEQNPFSVLKNLQQKFQDQNDAEKNQLAARGILSSGETGYQLGRIGQSQAQNQYDVTNSLLGNIGNLNDQYLAGQKAAAQQLSQGAFAAEQNAAANGVPQTTVSASWDPSTGAYKDPNGKYYDVNGNPIALPSAPAPPPAPSAPGVSGGQTIQQLAPGDRPLAGRVYGA